MIPNTGDNLRNDFTFTEPPSLTYRLSPEGEGIAGTVNGREAMEQAVRLILSTKRFKHIIYSWNYGIELEDLFGMPVDYCMVEIKRRVTEALLQDTRITDVTDFDTNANNGAVTASFTVKTIFGDIPAQKEAAV